MQVLPLRPTFADVAQPGRALKNTFYRSLSGNGPQMEGYRLVIERSSVRIRPSARVVCLFVRCAASTRPRGEIFPPLVQQQNGRSIGDLWRCKSFRADCGRGSKKPRREIVSLDQVGASPIGHPKEVLTVKRPSWPVKPAPSGQLRASRSTSTTSP